MRLRDKLRSALSSAEREVEMVRKRIIAEKVERAAVANAPYPLEERVADIDRFLASAFRHTPNIGVHVSPHGGGSFDNPELEALSSLGPFIRSARIGALERYLEARPPGLPKAERPARLAEIDARLLELEREEEAIIEAAEEAGLEIARRADADPRAILGID
jgi:hypothetical protein